MPPTLTFPGVYIEELPSGVHPITGVATSITAFVGRALRGPVDQAITITSFADFGRIYGGVWLESNLGYAVQDFYRNGGSTAIIVRVHKTKAGTDIASITIGSGNRQVALQAASPGAWGSKLTATIDDDVADPSDTSVFNLTVTDTGTGKIEQFRNVSFATGSARRFDLVLLNQSSLVRQTGSLPTQPQSSFPQTAAATGGGDGDPIDASLFTGGTLRADKKGLYALENADLVNLLVIPPYTAGGEIDSSVMTDTISYAVERRAVMIIDPPAAWTSVDNAVTGAGTFLSSANAAVYFPQIEESEHSLRDGQISAVAPSGAIAGIMARTDATRGVWKAPAGLGGDGGRRGRAERPADRPRDRQAEPVGVNCLRSSPGAGDHRLGARHARRRRPPRLGVEIPAGSAHSPLPRGVAVPRYAMGRLRAERRAAVGADPAKRRRVHEHALPPGRFRGQRRARRSSSSATPRPRRRTTSTSGSSTSSSASHR